MSLLGAGRGLLAAEMHYREARFETMPEMTGWPWIQLNADDEWPVLRNGGGRWLS